MRALTLDLRPAVGEDGAAGSTSMADTRQGLSPGKGIKLSFRTGVAALAIAIGLTAVPGAAVQDRPVQTVDRVDLSRYVGEWFEIARFPNKFQRQCLGDVRAVYALRQDGRLDVVNRCRASRRLTE